MEANQWADCAASYAIGKLAPNGVLFNPPPLKFPIIVKQPGGLRFQITIDGQTCDKDITRTVKRRLNDEFLGRVAMKAKQGMAYRAQAYLKHATRLVQNHGPSLALYRGLEHSHHRSSYKQVEYKLGSYLYWQEKEKYEPEMLPEIKEAVKDPAVMEMIKVCPFCVTRAQHRTATKVLPTGNTQHLHQHCPDVDLLEMRTKWDQIIGEVAWDYLKGIVIVLGKL